MVEIGLNLRVVLMDLIKQVDRAKSTHPNYLNAIREIVSVIKDLIKIDTIEPKDKLLESATEKVILDCANTLNNIIQEMPDKYESKKQDNKKYPTKSGYYWFYDNFFQKKRIVYYKHETKRVYYFELDYGLNLDDLNQPGQIFLGYFSKPMCPITEPQQ